MPFDEADKQFLEECINKRVTPISSNVISVEARLAELEAKLVAMDIIVKAQEARISAQDVLILNAARRRIETTFGESEDIFAYSDISSNIRIHCPDNSTIRVNSTEEVKEAVRDICRKWEPIPTEPESVYPGSNIDIVADAVA